MDRYSTDVGSRIAIAVVAGNRDKRTYE